MAYHGEFGRLAMLNGACVYRQDKQMKRPTVLRTVVCVNRNKLLTELTNCCKSLTLSVAMANRYAGWWELTAVLSSVRVTCWSRQHSARIWQAQLCVGSRPTRCRSFVANDRLIDRPNRDVAYRRLGRLTDSLAEKSWVPGVLYTVNPNYLVPIKISGSNEKFILKTWQFSLYLHFINPLI